MKLTELIVTIEFFLIAVAILTSSLLNTRKAVIKSEVFSNKAVVLSDNDALIRKEIKRINIPYWKNYEKEFLNEKVILEEHLLKLGEDRGFEIIDISAVYDETHHAEGIKVLWKFYDKEYICQEFIKQRIVSEE